MKVITDTQIILTAVDGKVYTDGESYVKNVVLPIDADDSKWSEIAVVDIPKDVEICGDEQVNDEEIQ
jgi:hypothetical protein